LPVLTDVLAAVVVESEGGGFGAAGGDRGFEVERGEHREAVGGEAEEGAGRVAGGRFALVDEQVEPGAVEEKGEGGAGDAGADDQRPAAAVRGVGHGRVASEGVGADERGLPPARPPRSVGGLGKAGRVRCRPGAGSRGRRAGTDSSTSSE
jgi:hypothetical protein